jgi:hypothetical protein
VESPQTRLFTSEHAQRYAHLCVTREPSGSGTTRRHITEKKLPEIFTRGVSEPAAPKLQLIDSVWQVLSNVVEPEMHVKITQHVTVTLPDWATIQTDVLILKGSQKLGEIEL